MLLLRIVYDSLSALIQVQNGFNISLLLTSRKDGVGAVIIREKKMCACERDKLLTLFYITPIFFFFTLLISLCRFKFTAAVFIFPIFLTLCRGDKEKTHKF